MNINTYALIASMMMFEASVISMVMAGLEIGRKSIADSIPMFALALVSTAFCLMFYGEFQRSVKEKLDKRN